MKKLLLGLVVAILGLSGTSASVGATDATISDTGPGSTNVIETKNDFECSVDNDNNFTVKNKNTQDAVSGTATVDDNTDADGAKSGSATNSNGTVINVEITNEGCVVTAVTPPAPVAPSGGQGAVAAPAGGQGAVTPVAAPSKAAPTVLPNTSAESTIGIVAGLVAALGLAVIGSRFAVGAYSNLKS